MRTDKDRPSTWVKYQDHFCNSCYAGCCTMPVEVKAEDLIRLGIATVDEVEISKKKLAKRLIKEGLISSYRDSSDLFMIQSRPNGDCHFLNEKTRLCTVYEKRPEVCRQFPQVGPRVSFCPYTKK